MALKFRKKVLLAKIESVYGTDPTPTGAANAIRTQNLEIRPLEGGTVSRETDRAMLGNEVQIHVGTHVMAEFDVEISGGGAAGTAPAYAPLLRACGLDETIDPGVDVQYDPISVSEESVTCYLYFDGQKHAMTGCRGTVTMNITPLQIPRYHFTLTGLWVAPAAEADPTADISAFTAPVAVTDTATPTASLHAVALEMEAFTFDQNNDVQYRHIVGGESVEIVDRAPGGSVTIQAPALGTKNWFTTALANTTGALQVVHGTTAGNIVQLDATLVQVLNPAYGESQGIRTLQMGLSIVPTAGNDDFKITVK